MGRSLFALIAVLGLQACALIDAGVGEESRDQPTSCGKRACYGAGADVDTGPDPVSAVATGWLFGDGVVDVVFSTWPGDALLYNSTDAGALIASGTLSSGGAAGGAVGRFTDDANDDVVTIYSQEITVPSTTMISVFPTDGTPLPPVEIGGRFVSWCHGQYTDDDIEDLVIVMQDTREVVVMTNDGQDNWTELSRFGVNADPVDVVCVDFNNDNYGDIAVAHRDSDGFSTWLNNLQGGLDWEASYASALPPGAITSGWFGGNEQMVALALACGACDASYELVSVVAHDGVYLGGFRFQEGTGFDAADVVSEDFDGDGNSDVAVLSGLGGDLGDDSLILFGSASGVFVDPLSVPMGAEATSFAIGELNGDGVMDFLVTAGAEASVLLSE